MAIKEIVRNRLPSTRKGITHRAVINTEKGRLKFFVTVNCYEDTGKPAELFLTFDESGGVDDGWADAWATAISVCLQRGEPLENIVAKYSFMQFEPSGRTDNPDVRLAKSVPDYVCRWMSATFAPKGEKEPETSVLPVPGP